MTEGKNLKKEARVLRGNGLSYNEIAKKVGISKSTAKYWCNDIELKPEDRKRLYTKQIRLLSKGSKSSHDRRQVQIKILREKAKNEIKLPISSEAFMLFGAALYWAEGNKVSDFTITNSDPLLIKFMCNWFRKIFGVTKDSFKAHLNIYSGQKDLEIKKFWSDITEIPIKNFGKSFIKPVSKNYKKNSLYYGTIKVRVARGTDYRHRVFGWIDAILKNTGAHVENVERKWYKLKDNYTRV